MLPKSPIKAITGSNTDLVGIQPGEAESHWQLPECDRVNRLDVLQYWSLGICWIKLLLYTVGLRKPEGQTAQIKTLYSVAQTLRAYHPSSAPVLKACWMGLR